jgi:hypothetical protein
MYDYPVKEAICSILPLCDDIVVAVGKSDDATLELIQNIHPEKIKIIETEWDNSLRKGGRVLALETDKAYQAISEKSDWCFYIQADEIIHEKYHSIIKKGMERWLHEDAVDGLLFKYLHFYGSFDYIATSNSWYKNEIRIIRKNKEIYSYKDAQGFRKQDNKKLSVKALDAYVYHYGWVKPPINMQLKQKTFQKLWHTDEWVKNHVSDAIEFDYSGIDRLEKFDGSHPEVMKRRIEAMNWKFTHDISRNKTSFKEKLKQFSAKYLGKDFTYKNYRII